MNKKTNRINNSNLGRYFPNFGNFRTYASADVTKIETFIKSVIQVLDNFIRISRCGLF